MKTTEEIYQTLLAAFAQRAGFTPEADCDLAVRLYAAAAELQALGIQSEWVLDQSFPQTARGVYLDYHAQMRGIARTAATKAVGTLPLFCGAGAVYGSAHRRRNGLHDGGRDPVPNHGGGGAGSRGAVRGCSGGGLGAWAERQCRRGDHRDPHRLPGGDHRMHQSGALHRRQ